MDNKPAYKDFKKQKKYMLQKGGYIESGGRIYTLGDRWLFHINNFLFLLMAVSVFTHNPYYNNHLYSYLYSAGAILLIFLLLWAYQRLTYHFSWFHEHKARGLDASDNAIDDMSIEYEKIDTVIQYQKKWKSSIVSISFTVFLILFGFLFHYFFVGQAYQRLFNDHKKELDQLTQIAQKYYFIQAGNFYPQPKWLDGMVTENDPKTDLPDCDADVLRTICSSLNGYFVDNIYSGQDNLCIRLASPLNHKSLEWYPVDMTAEHIINDSAYDTKAVRLDDHWWCVW